MARIAMAPDGMQLPWSPASLYVATSSAHSFNSERNARSSSLDHPANLFLAAPAEQKQQKIALYSTKYFQACTIGGILACGALPYTMQISHASMPQSLAHEDRALVQGQHTPA